MISIQFDSAVTPALKADIQKHFRLSSQSVHGPAHWARVRMNGLLLCPYTGADPVVVELFSILHDSQRYDDGYDIEHGPRAADYIQQIHGQLFQVTDVQLDALIEACIGHTKGFHHPNVTEQTCWDADRLDIERVGMRLDTRYLGTDAAKNGHMIAYATSASRGRPDRSFAQIQKDLAVSLSLL